MNEIALMLIGGDTVNLNRRTENGVRPRGLTIKPSTAEKHRTVLRANHQTFSLPILGFHPSLSHLLSLLRQLGAELNSSPARNYWHLEALALNTNFLVSG
uniref:Uncharacterized protein n=1 Tax=Nelumbo nucifera TaxID=4432 RepID=A0A822XT59_NELNU|nr:TPA_asm: hypothetical protein HUJ06_026258 [Nelumbo nucifera]